MSVCVVANIYKRNIPAGLTLEDAVYINNDMKDLFNEYSMYLVINTKKSCLDEAARIHKKLTTITKTITNLIHDIKKMIEEKDVSLIDIDNTIKYVVNIHKHFYGVFDRFSTLKFERDSIEQVFEMYAFRIESHGTNKDLDEFLTVNFKRMKRTYINNLLRKMNRMREIMSKTQTGSIDKRLIQTMFTYKDLKDKKLNRVYIKKDRSTEGYISDSSNNQSQDSQQEIVVGSDPILDMVADYIITDAIKSVKQAKREKPVSKKELARKVRRF